MRTYVQARAAAIGGDHRQAAQLLAALAQVQPGQPDIAKRALSEAIGTGQYDLALNLARSVPSAELNSDARLLLVASEVRNHRLDRAQQWLAVKGDTGDLTFLTPLLTAWDAAESEIGRASCRERVFRTV